MILRPVTDEEILDLDVPGESLSRKDLLKNLVFTANHFKLEGAKEVKSALTVSLGESNSKGDFYLRVLAIMSALEEELV